VDARVYGGMHFREGCARGAMQGTMVGRYVFQNVLRPLPGGLAREHRD
jgi:hypothetical protein